MYRYSTLFILYVIVKALFECSTGITAREVWSRKPYSTRRSRVLYGFRDHNSNAVIPVLHEGEGEKAETAEMAETDNKHHICDV